MKGRGTVFWLLLSLCPALGAANKLSPSLPTPETELGCDVVAADTAPARGSASSRVLEGTEEHADPPTPRSPVLHPPWALAMAAASPHRRSPGRQGKLLRRQQSPRAATSLVLVVAPEVVTSMRSSGWEGAGEGGSRSGGCSALDRKCSDLGL